MHTATLEDINRILCDMDANTLESVYIALHNITERRQRHERDRKRKGFVALADRADRRRGGY